MLEEAFKFKGIHERGCRPAALVWNLSADNALQHPLSLPLIAKNGLMI